jgi:antagonist of KipI
MAAVSCIEIVSPGLQTTIQDLGRYGFGRYGVPPSGALDSFAQRIANLLVDNPEGQAVLETTLMGLGFKALTDVLIAITGADLKPQVDKRSVEMWRSFILEKNEILSFAGPQSGCRAYIAFGSGINIPSVLDSRSTNLPCGFGGLEGRVLRKGDIIPVDSPQSKLEAAGRAVNSQWIPNYTSPWTLRVVWGPQHEDFTQKGLHTFINSLYTVSPQSDRTGIRLEGLTIERKSETPESIISEGITSGSIQVPGDGKPIIILGETVTGGYRKIATVVSADLASLGQVKPGDEINFKPISIDEALRNLKEIEDRIKNAI